MNKKLYPFLSCLAILANNAPGILAQEMPGPGEIIITEFLADPGAVSDTYGEWFEILNNSGKTLLLNGLIIKDDGSNRHVVQSDGDLTLSPGNYFVLARSADPLLNGGIVPDYVYTNFVMGNTEDEIILCLPDESVLDRLAYGDGWKISKGASLELFNEYNSGAFNDDPENWNLSSVPFGAGDLGSPGSVNSSSTGIAQTRSNNYLEVFPNPCFGILNIRMEYNQQAPVEVSLINMIGQEILVFESTSCRKLDLPFNTQSLEKGLWIVRVSYGGETDISKVLIY